uniref:ATP synthase complex subunit 8 n=1 Tax=Alloeorhynchus sp. TaxID=2931281 RepID=A0A8T9ZXN5_9HEMI|nr:ATPase subunit 8 [Alloeorhynchus sp.]
MPQMAPLWWTVLFIMFISAMLLTMMLTYFNWNPQPSSSLNIKHSPNQYSWKW